MPKSKALELKLACRNHPIQLNVVMKSKISNHAIASAQFIFFPFFVERFEMVKLSLRYVFLMRIIDNNSNLRLDK